MVGKTEDSGCQGKNIKYIGGKHKDLEKEFRAL